MLRSLVVSKSVSIVGGLLEDFVHCVYYFVEVFGGGAGYKFRWGVRGPYSDMLHRDLVRGRLRKVKVDVWERVEELMRKLGCDSSSPQTCLYLLSIAARLHMIVSSTYPPVDDPVEYIVARFPGIRREDVERVWRILVEEGLI
ncbi:MAG TPA: hypothetical protein EYH26_04605 [Pyrodictium sp.]|nr:hypothetical protein [Pyrodictium sp.]HIQ11230.1 hypothetical protein [Pyrodictium sp.]HIQ55802.1 hypothetical protein [Pyrodictium sp.]